MTDQMVMKRVAAKKNIQDNNLQNHTVPAYCIYTYGLDLFYLFNKNHKRSYNDHTDRNRQTR